MQEALAGEYEFQVITRNHDLGDRRAYRNIVPGQWYDRGGVKVWYLPSSDWLAGSIRRAIGDCRPDLYYFQSAFDPRLTIRPLVLRRLGVIPGDIPAVVAPRGEFSGGALSLKAAKKQAFLRAQALIGLYDDVTWQATNAEEALKIEQIWGPKAKCRIAPNISSSIPELDRLSRLPKVRGTLRLVFLGRIARMKNLDGALRMLRDVTCQTCLDIYGDREDRQYWEECLHLMGELPANIRAEYQGPALPEDVFKVLAGHDALLLPTLGENFGHVISEALLAGCPVIISDRTPWRGLVEKEAGFDLPLESPGQFRAAIERLAGMDEAEFSRWSSNARALGVSRASDPEPVELTRRLLADAMTAGAAR